MFNAPLQSSSFTRCERCGLSSTLAAAFTLDKRKKPFKRLCPRCARDARIERAAHDRRQWLLGAGVGLLFVLFFQGWAYGNLVFFAAPATLLGVVCHELGHAVVGSSLGLEIFKITIGIGPVRFERRWLGYQWELRRYVTGGRVWIGVPGERRVLRRFFVMVLAGPATNFLLAGAAALLLRYSDYAESFFDGPAPLTVLALVNLLLGVANLRSYKNAAGNDSDGKLLALCLRQPAEQRQRIRESYYMQRFLALRRERRADDELALAAEAVRADAKSARLLTLLGVAQIDTKRFTDARASFEAALASATDAALIAIQHNNLAFVGLASGDPLEVGRSAEKSARAYDVLPWEPSIAMTRSAFLLLEGRAHDAAAAVEQVVGEEMPEHERKDAVMTLALAHERSGNSERASELRRDAAQISGDAPFHARLEHLLAVRVQCST